MSSVVEHIVLFKWKGGTSKETISGLAAALNSLRSCHVVLSVSFGESFTTARAKGFTHGLIVRLPDKAALPVYAKHPDHVAVLKKLGPHVEDILAIDFEAEPLSSKL